MEEKYTYYNTQVDWCGMTTKLHVTMPQLRFYLADCISMRLHAYAHAQMRNMSGNVCLT